MIKQRSLHISWRDISIVFIPTSIFLLGTLLTDVFGHQDLSITFCKTNANEGYIAGGRYLFFTSFMLFIFIAGSVLVIFRRDYVRYFDEDGRKKLFSGCAFVVAVIAIFVLLGHTFGAPHTYELLGKGVFEETMQIASSGGPDWVPHHKGGSSMLTVYLVMLFVANIFTAAGVASVILGSISCLANKPGTKMKEQETIQIYQLERLRKYLYMSSVLLVTGVLLIMSWLYWPVALFGVGSAEQAEFVYLANGLAAFFGVNYSLVLLAYYLPVTLTLSGRANEIIDGRVSRSKTEIPASTLLEWRQELGATVSFASAYKSTFAVLSPFLTGSFGAIVSALTGSG